MSETVRKHAAFFLLLFAVLLIVPSVSYGAESGGLPASSAVKDSGGAPSSVPFYSFPAGTTVEALTQQLAPQGKDEVLWVLKPDGSVRAGGPIETGDVVEVLDRTGQLLSRVIAQVAGGAASSSAASPWPSEENGWTVFAPGTTVETLQEELSAAGADGCRLKVKSHSGRIRGSGDICTGDTLTVQDAGGNALSSTTAVVPGDLTRCGLPTNEACDLLYAHLIRRSELSGDLLNAADLNRDGAVDTSDLLLLKKAVKELG